MNEHWNHYPIIRGLHTISSILPVIRGQGYIAGSYAAFMASTAPCVIEPSDIDIFAVSEEAARAMGTRIGQVFNWPPYIEGPDVIGWDLPSITPHPLLPIQIIKPAKNWHTFPDDIMAAFDLSVSRALVLDTDDGTSILADDGIHTPEVGKILVINDPVRTLRRAAKYMARGVKFTDWELLKVCDAWEKMGPERQAEKMNVARDLAFPQVSDDDLEPEGAPDYSFRDDEDDYRGD